VRPNENIETYVSTLAKTIGSPLLTNVDVKFEFDKPEALPRPPISRTYPRKLTDLFAGEQLVWVGRYYESGSVKLTLSGDLAGKRQTYTLAANLVAHSIPDANAFVEKVWAARRIGELIDEIDLNGNNRELTDELVQLSLKHGIMTPYTSFLADEHVDLADRRILGVRAGESLMQLQRTDGASGFVQRNYKSQAKAVQNVQSQPMYGGFAGGFAQFSNSPTVVVKRPAPGLQDGLEAAKKPAVQTVADKTFYWKNNRWRDADLTAETEKDAIKVQQFSEAYFALASRDNGRFAKFLTLDGPIVLRLDGKTYLIEPAATN
jgi:Ca-activated chloride channel homolog